MSSGRKPLSAQRRQKAIKRLKIVASFNQRDDHGRRLNDPKAMILDVVPVIDTSSALKRAIDMWPVPDARWQSLQWQWPVPTGAEVML